MFSIYFVATRDADDDEEDVTVDITSLQLPSLNQWGQLIGRLHLHDTVAADFCMCDSFHIRSSIQMTSLEIRGEKT